MQSLRKGSRPENIDRDLVQQLLPAASVSPAEESESSDGGRALTVNIPRRPFAWDPVQLVGEKSTPCDRFTDREG